MTLRHPPEFSIDKVSLKDIYRAIERTEERIRADNILISALLIIIAIML